MSNKIKPVDIDESKYNTAELDPFVFQALVFMLGMLPLANQLCYII
jgi:hypothetical protein